MEIFEWKNGNKVSDAYVEVDGAQIPVVSAVYEGETPYSAENMNQMQRQIGAYVDENTPKMRAYINLEDETDLNTILTCGTYRSTASAHTSTMQNVPSDVTGGFTLYVSAWTSTYANESYRRQEIKIADRTYIRYTQSSGSSWSDWEKVSTTTYGSDSNGNYIKYSDGTLVYYGRVAIGTINTGGTTKSVTFTQSFTNTDYSVTLTMLNGGTNFNNSNVTVKDVTKNGFKIYVYANQNSTQIPYYSYLAIGRWK